MKDTEKYKALSTPVRIANVEIRNRIAMAPMSLESIIQFVDADRGFPNVRRIGDCLKLRNIQGTI